MLGLGSLIGGAMKIGGSIFGGISASRAMKNVKKNLEGQMADNQSWYDRRYNEDATQRADAQRMLQLTEENIRNRNRQAAGTAAVMGGTDESLAAAREANANAIADTAAQIAVAGANRKDAVENQYMANKANINNQLNNLEMNKANAISKAMSGVNKTASDLAGSALDEISIFGKKKAQETEA